MQFQLARDIGTSLEEKLVLAGKFFSKRFGEDFLGGLAQQLLLGGGSATSGESLVDHEVASVGILDEVDNVRNGIKKLPGQIGLRELGKERMDF